MIELISEVAALIASSLAVVIAGHELHSKKNLESEVGKKKSQPTPQFK